MCFLPATIYLLFLFNNLLEARNLRFESPNSTASSGNFLFSTIQFRQMAKVFNLHHLDHQTHEFVLVNLFITRQEVNQLGNDIPFKIAPVQA